MIKIYRLKKEYPGSPIVNSLAILNEDETNSPSIIYKIRTPKDPAIFSTSLRKSEVESKLEGYWIQQLFTLEGLAPEDNQIIETGDSLWLIEKKTGIKSGIIATPTHKFDPIKYHYFINSDFDKFRIFWVRNYAEISFKDILSLKEQKHTRNMGVGQFLEILEDYTNALYKF
tara:strand:- start:73724 stop:74239 length:516 start_codon:yes stop_codon:yes gene_type:complete